jgi:hypothetical protein
MTDADRDKRDFDSTIDLVSNMAKKAGLSKKDIASVLLGWAIEYDYDAFVDEAKRELKDELKKE